MTTPRSSCPGGEYHSSPGRKPPARSKINTNTVLETGSDLCRSLSQLHTAWIIFGKYTWIDSGKRRSKGVVRDFHDRVKVQELGR